MHFFEQAPANTTLYMIAGYAVFTLVMLSYLASLVVRFRRLQKDLNTLQQLEKKK